MNIGTLSYAQLYRLESILHAHEVQTGTEEDADAESAHAIISKALDVMNDKCRATCTISVME